MKKAIVTLESVSPYSQSKFHQVPKNDKELDNDYENRTWREKLHYDENGMVYIPPMQFCNSLKEAAKYLSLPIPGKARSLFTKNFESGIMVVDSLDIGINKDQVRPEHLFVPSDGKRGGTKRVMKIFPLIEKWKGDVTYHIFDNIITKEAFETVLRTSGQLIGIGRFRPRNWGWYGRFRIVNIKWIEN